MRVTEKLHELWLFVLVGCCCGSQMAETLASDNAEATSNAPTAAGAKRVKVATVASNVDTVVASNVCTALNLNLMTEPSVLHGQRSAKAQLNAFGNSLTQTFREQCLTCQKDCLELDERNLPLVSLAIVITQAVPFFDMFLDKIERINYPKDKMHLFIYSNQTFHDKTANSFVKRLETEYLSAKIVLSSDELSEERGRTLALEQAKSKKSDYMLVVEAVAHIDDPDLLRELLAANKQSIGPVMSKYDGGRTNFVGGKAAHSLDYEDIIQRSTIGLWNVDYVSSVYLIKSSAIKHIKFDHRDLDSNMAMCDLLRKAGISVYVTNQRVFGHLVNADNFDTSVARPDFYTLFSNKFDWIKKYIHPDYGKQLEPNHTFVQPCPDVFKFPVVTDAFCDDLIVIIEHFGKWSGNRSPYLTQSFVVREISMEKIGLDQMWAKFLELFAHPLQQRIFVSNNESPFRIVSTIIRYRHDDRPLVEPHNDGSTSTVSIALNSPGIDFQGGGCHFVPYNCTVQVEKGYMLLHPGLVSHKYEGLPVTNGTRYIVVSFLFW